MTDQTLDLVRDVTALMRAHAKRDGQAIDALLGPYYEDPAQAAALLRATIGISWASFCWVAETVDEDPEELLERFAIDFARKDGSQT